MATAQQQRDRKTRDADSALRLLVRLLARAAAHEAVSTSSVPNQAADAALDATENENG